MKISIILLALFLALAGAMVGFGLDFKCDNVLLGVLGVGAAIAFFLKR